MTLKIYNSLTKKKEEFTPLEKGKVKMYVCGPTVYDEPHIGHLRSAYVFEVIRSYLEYSGYKVTFVRNVTDVDDKIIDKAKESGATALIEEVKKVSKKYYELYRDELKTLDIQPPSKEPKATEHIKEMIQLIKRLLEKGFAYEAGGGVYFSVEGFAGYGKLSGQKKEAMLEGVRGEPGENKKSPLDFALWKKVKEGEPAWDSPWGKGRPGWHIECSAMSMRYLGESFDIHGGGLDLVFPHHENEIAQSEAATGKPFVKYWIHHGLVTREGHKMSKSLKNFITLEQINSLYKFAGSDYLKYLFLGTHYASPLNYSTEVMCSAIGGWSKLYYFFEEARQLKYKQCETKTWDQFKDYKMQILKAVDDDFNTSQALTALYNVILASRKTMDSGYYLHAAIEIKKLCQAIFRIFLELNDSFEGKRFLSVTQEDQINELIKQRKELKIKKDYETADSIRIKIASTFNVELIDWKDGSTTYRWIIAKALARD